MPSVTRVGDTTVGSCDVGEDCCPHGRAGTNSIGSPNVFINGEALHRLGDQGPCNCPHGGVFNTTSSSSTVFCNGIGVSRIGDSTSCGNCGCGGSHIGGSPNVFAGG